ncbi:MAG TPA: tetratricopeptide repeat protein [Thermoanaerobaculia bacterium]|jgi:tetratricopeptide (TPR) repeat protein|nr:tetratricopeptide repeat protein [Thermoanaerobaculia bacterium]
MIRVRTLAALIIIVVAASAQASWYDDYDAGLAAARSGNWSAVVSKMSAAIKAQPNENNKARTYGAIFINYHPYYYRGVAYLNLGRYQQAIDDLERTSGPGPENLGSIGELLDRAKRQLAASTVPEPEPQRPEPKPEPARPLVTPPAPVPNTPAAPSIDPALRQRASSALAAAKQKLQAAQQRRASQSPQYAQAMSIFTDATTRNAGAKSNEDLNAIISMAGNAADLAELAMPPNAPAPALTPSNVPAPSRPSIAADAVLEDYKPQLRRALENYFNGEFADAARDFRDLTTKLPKNGWIWAFLGASQYSQYAFEADESYRKEALKAFRKAKALRTWKGGLPEKYFSKRIRRAFEREG